MHWVTESDHLHAQDALLAAGRRQESVVDCSSFHVMRCRMVRAAFAFDLHFREQGFDVLPDVTGGAGEGESSPAPR